MHGALLPSTQTPSWDCPEAHCKLHLPQPATPGGTTVLIELHVRMTEN
jgi:hypothetical protein